MLQAGLMVEEVSDLEVKDVTINSRSGMVVVRQGKRDKYREVPLNKDARDAINDYIIGRNKHKFKDSPFLFVSERSPQMSTRAIQHLIERYGERGRIEGLTCHKLRHSFCHNLILANQGLQTVALLAGHSSLETSRIYTVDGVAQLQEAVDRIAFEE